ncbi:MAG: R3H domain-containing nucleic acid-binding protein [Actinomycetes bacterium]|jgi:spoIIIJ-associated protein
MATPEEAQERTLELLEQIVDALDLDAEIEVDLTDDGVTGTLHGDDLGLFIGKHGQTIDAVQHLATRIIQRDAGDDERIRVEIDAEGYRARRREQLEQQAEEAAEKALSDENPVDLPAMNAAERRIVHQHLRDREDVDTHSEGDEPRRYLVITPVIP